MSGSVSFPSLRSEATGLPRTLSLAVKSSRSSMIWKAIPRFMPYSASASTLSGGALERVEALAEYGMNLGMAFQIIDDLLDFTASESVLGKPVASDLKEGKLTLPLIYLLQESEPAARVMVQTVLEERDFRTVQ